MQKYQHFNFLINLLYAILKLFLVILLFMSLSRLYIFLNYGSMSTYSFSELLSALWLGVRLDASVLAYINVLGILLIFFIWLLRLKFLQNYLYPFFRAYFILFLTLLALLTFIDLTYFSFFGEHSTLMIFGVFDDDTGALIRTALGNYNVSLVAFLCLAFFAFLYFVIFKTIIPRQKIEFSFNWFKQLGLFLLIIVTVALLGRGSIGLFPLAYAIPDVSPDPLVNKLPQTAGYAILNSYEQYSKSKSGNYDLIKKVGYRGKVPEAFKVFKQSEDIDRGNLLNNLIQKTSKNEALKKIKPHVVVVMAESFGMPLLNYQSDSFNIMGKIKKHFQEDTIFTNFISSSNGTVVSLEPMLLNITARPKSTSFAQSSYLNSSFTHASAKVYADAGYETNFIYGGDLSWRNVGSFMSRQGFKYTWGKGTIAKSLDKNIDSISHDWGVFDEYLYEYVYKKLKDATSPQFIFILTTNNHPPYTIPSHYKSNSLELSQDLKEHITGDLELVKRRFKDYAYAVDSLGGFLDKVKESSLAKNSVIAITADNNTVEGVMRYDK
ncbi:MAG: sulfatase-like hydrolase/transferase, partial [Campylobacterota bacterium]|nr:sulfatase-like hydrolase/transferase [Campylobacterota bacterium]